MQKDGHQGENQHEGSVKLTCNLLQGKREGGRFGQCSQLPGSPPQVT